MRKGGTEGQQIYRNVSNEKWHYILKDKRLKLAKRMRMEMSLQAGFPKEAHSETRWVYNCIKDRLAINI